MATKQKYFFGNEISQYGQENGYVDYRTLAKAFGTVLANDLIPETRELGFDWELVNGRYEYYENDEGEVIGEEEYLELDYEEQEKWYSHWNEIFQYFVITWGGYDILKTFTNEIVFYNETLNLYVWGVTHWGTGWDYVLTEIPVDR